MQTTLSHARLCQARRKSGFVGEFAVEHDLIIDKNDHATKQNVPNQLYESYRNQWKMLMVY